MFEDVDGTVVLSDWVTSGQLAEAVAAQLKFAFEPDGPFVGRKGRTRLAVLDGMLTTGVADHLLEQLGERENLVVVAMTLEEGVAEHLRKQRPGSRARKVPRDLARSGKLAPRLVRLEREAQLGDGR
jgi:adenine-specific DNA-methyltransferase